MLFNLLLNGKHSSTALMPLNDPMLNQKLRWRNIRALIWRQVYREII